MRICSSPNINLPIDPILPLLFGQALAVPWVRTALEAPAHVWIASGGVEDRAGAQDHMESSTERQLTI